MTPIAAATFRSIAAGILRMARRRTTAYSAKPPLPVEAMTRSPGARSVMPAPTARTMPPTSEPGAKGMGGWLWYLPATISTSG